MEINNAKIIVTGGTLGIGKETARQLVKLGAQVVITGRNPERLAQTAKDTGAIPIVFDIADLDKIPEKAAECREKLGGKVDALINNAGIGEFPAIEDLSAEIFLKVFNTNVFGLALLSKEVVKTMRVQQNGTIINIGSTAAQKGFARGTVYAGSKFALRAMTQAWQAELRKDNIRVSLVNPSEVTATAFNNPFQKENQAKDNKLDSQDIAHTIISVLEAKNKSFIPEVTVWATNPF